MTDNAEKAKKCFTEKYFIANSRQKHLDRNYETKGGKRRGGGINKIRRLHNSSRNRRTAQINYS